MSKGVASRRGGGAGAGGATSPAGKAAERLGIELTPEFETLYEHDEFRSEVDRLAQQVYEVKKGWRKESETSYGRHGLTPDEYAAAQVYSGWSYRSINNALRSPNEATEKQREQAKAFEKTINRALERLNAQPGVAYRGIGENRLGALGNVKPDDVIRDKGFASSSTSRNVATGFGRHTLVITHKSGRDFSKVVGGGEKEVLFKTGTKFRVTKVETDSSGNKVIHVNEV